MYIYYNLSYKISDIKYMASTRNKNTIIDYKLQQNINSGFQNYNLYENGASGKQVSLNMPGNGFGHSVMRGRQLAYNQIDLESFLRGTGTVDLATGHYLNITPDLKYISSINAYKKEPTLVTDMNISPSRDRPWPI